MATIIEELHIDRVIFDKRDLLLLSWGSLATLVDARYIVRPWERGVIGDILRQVLLSLAL